MARPGGDPPVITHLNTQTGDPDDGGQLTSAQTSDPDDGGQISEDPRGARAAFPGWATRPHLALISSAAWSGTNVCDSRGARMYPCDFGRGGSFSGRGLMAW